MSLESDYQKALAASSGWHHDFRREAIGGDRRFTYVPFYKLNQAAQSRARSAYPHSSGGAYNFRPEHYFYPVKKDGSLASAPRELAIPLAKIKNARFMASLGYVKNPAAKGGTKKLGEASQFFYKHAGYSYGAGETPEQGRKKGAEQLAKAERYADDHGWTVSWEYDDRPWDGDGEAPGEILVALLKDKHGKVIASLGGIGDPDKDYRRVVEAELALEAMPKSAR